MEGKKALIKYPSSTGLHGLKEARKIWELEHVAWQIPFTAINIRKVACRGWRSHKFGGKNHLY